MLKTNISDVSGYCVIDPDGVQGENPFTVYCNMSGEGGVGVTVVVITARAGPTSLGLTMMTITSVTSSTLVSVYFS